MTISTGSMIGKLRKATETIRRVILGASSLPAYHKRDLAEALAAGEDVAAALEAEAKGTGEIPLRNDVAGLAERLRRLLDSSEGMSNYQSDEIESIANALAVATPPGDAAAMAADPIPVLRGLIGAMGLPRLLDRCREANASLAAEPGRAGHGGGGWGDGEITRTLDPGYYDRISGDKGDERDQT